MRVAWNAPSVPAFTQAAAFPEPVSQNRIAPARGGACFVSSIPAPSRVAVFVITIPSPESRIETRRRELLEALGATGAACRSQRAQSAQRVRRFGS